MHRLFYLIAALTAFYATQAPSRDLVEMSIVGAAMIAVAGRCYQVACHNYGFGTAPPAPVPARREEIVQERKAS